LSYSYRLLSLISSEYAFQIGGVKDRIEIFFYLEIANVIIATGQSMQELSDLAINFFNNVFSSPVIPNTTDYIFIRYNTAPYGYAMFPWCGPTELHVLQSPEFRESLRAGVTEVLQTPGLVAYPL
jgi:hypothetical protein